MDALSSSTAALRISSQLPRAFRVLPVGLFHAHDGRPNGEWRLSPDVGRAIAALAGQKADGFLIDYEHESLKRDDAPEAGRFHSLEWRDDGLYVTDAVWTAEAKSLISNDKKRFISPVFKFNPASGEVVSLESIALTADPALLGLTDLSQVAVASAQAPAVPGLDMDGRSREAFERVFGHAPEQMAALHAEKADPPPEGVTEEDWAKLRHVFGDKLHVR